MNINKEIEFIKQEPTRNARVEKYNNWKDKNQ